MSRTFADFEFRIVCAIQPERDTAGQILEDYPELRFDNPRNLSLNKYGRGPFCRFRIPSEWSGRSGVYILTRNGVPVYAGKCDDLAVRFNMGYGQISPRNCYQGGQETNCRINAEILRAVQSGARIELFFHSTSNSAEIEAAVISRLQTPWNRQIPSPPSISRPGLSSPVRSSADTPVGREIPAPSMPPASFEDFWRMLTTGLSNRTVIRNWTVDKGHLGQGDFTAQAARDYVLCDAPGAGHLQRVPKRDFEMMFERWNAYLHGAVRRSEMRDFSRFTKYTISILHHFLGGQATPSRR